jgi:hypothetical protein
LPEWADDSFQIELLAGVVHIVGSRKSRHPKWRRDFFVMNVPRRSQINFDLLGAFASPGCPICELIQRDSKRHLDTLYYERTMDPGLRAALRRSIGFCNYHAWQSTEIQNVGLSIGVIYEDLLDVQRRDLSEIIRDLKGKNRGRLFHFWKRPSYDESVHHRVFAPDAPCPVCSFDAQFTVYYLREMIRSISEQEFEEGYRSSSGLCIPHMQMLIGTFWDHPNLPAILELQSSKLDALSKELKEFIRKHDYRFKDEPRGTEFDSWRRAVEQFAGKRASFSNQIWEQYWKKEVPGERSKGIVDFVRRIAMKLRKMARRRRSCDAPRDMDKSRARPSPDQTVPGCQFFSQPGPEEDSDFDSVSG